MDRRFAAVALICAVLLGVVAPHSALANGTAPTIEFNVGMDAANFGPWMFDQDATPFVPDSNPVYAYASLVWNPTGAGNKDVQGSGGSGNASFGTCTAENTSVQNGIAAVTLEFGNLSLASVEKRNWLLMGQAGDHRVYTGGTGTIKVGGVPKLKVTNARISMDVNWPAPVGPGDSIAGSGWGTIDATSDPAWKAEFDNGSGQVEFVFSSFSPVVQSYYGFFTSHVVVRGAANKENMQIVNITATGPYQFPDAKVSLIVNSFQNGGLNSDQNAFFANQIVKDPGGAAPAGIRRVIPYCYWKLGTVLNAITTAVTFDFTGVPGTDNPANLRILKRASASNSWEVYTDWTLVDATHIRANGVTSFSEFAVGVIPTPGDASDDGKLNAQDVTSVERIAASLDARTAGADANQDGSVNATDITKVERIIAGLDPGMSLTSTAFQEGGNIPQKHAIGYAGGQNISPALAWADVPGSIQSFALIVDDPDAPVGTWTHWVLFNLPSADRQLAEGISASGTLANGAKQGTNDFGTIGYGGPGPPPGPAHHYQFRLFALDNTLSLAAGATRQQVMTAMNGHVLAQAVLTGLYQRPA